jgi:hypothetical protein
MPRLKAEEELMARAAASHPFLEARDRKQIVRSLEEASGTVQPVQKATHADLRSIGITVKESADG